MMSPWVRGAKLGAIEFTSILPVGTQCINGNEEQARRHGWPTHWQLL